MGEHCPSHLDSGSHYQAARVARKARETETRTPILSIFLKVTEDLCELRDDVFKMDIKRLQVRVLCFFPYQPATFLCHNRY